MRATVMYGAGDVRQERSTSGAGIWSAVGSMALYVALLIAAEFMPVSLLTPIANDLGATVGMAGQAISISGLFAVITSLCIATFAARFDRRHVLVGLTGVMLCSLVLIALAPNYSMLMVARALLGVVIGGFWALVPVVVVNMIWQWKSLPAMPPRAANPVGKLFGLLQRRHVAFGMLGVMLTFAGAFAAFTYLRPFLETRTQVTVPQLSLLLLGLGVAGFIGTYGVTTFVRRHLYLLLGGLPVALGVVTLSLLALQHSMWAVGLTMIAWGTLNSAIPVSWSTWLTKGISDEPDSGGGLMVAAIQLSIMLGGAFGGYLLDSVSVGATFIGGSLLLFAAAAVVGTGKHIRPRTSIVRGEGYMKYLGLALMSVGAAFVSFAGCAGGALSIAENVATQGLDALMILRDWKAR